MTAPRAIVFVPNRGYHCTVRTCAPSARCEQCREDGLTADTITDAQIDALWWIACGGEGQTHIHQRDHRKANPDVMHACTVATNRHGDFSSGDQAAARTRCADLLSDRRMRVTGELDIAMRVKMKRGSSDVGTLLQFVEPKPGKRRALVHWQSDGCDQFVDLDKLEPAS